MLPDKRALRKAIEPFKNSIPKAVRSYFKCGDCKDFAIATTAVSVNQKRVFALMFYSEHALEYVSFCNRSFDFITMQVNKPVKWYKSNLRDLPFIRSHYVYGVGYSKPNTYQLISTTGFYVYFKINDKTVNPISYIHDNVCKKKEEFLLRNRYENALRRNNEFEERYQKIPKSVLTFGKKQKCFGLFDLGNRHSVHCTECGCDFETSEAVKNNSIHTCPHCRNNLICKTEKTFSKCYEYGVQYIDKTKFGNLCVRHFLCEKRYDRKAKTMNFDYFEYERDEFARDAEYEFRYYVNRFSGLCGQYLWRKKKPYIGSMISMRYICYEDEPLYKGNLKQILKDTEYEYSALEYIDCNLRAEEYIVKFLAVPKIEILVKAGYFYLVYNSGSADLKEVCSRGNSPATMLGMNKEFREILKDSGASCDDAEILLDCYNRNMSVKSAFEVFDYFFMGKGRRLSYISSSIYDNIHSFLGICQRVGCTTHKAIKYLSQPENNYQLWKDYIGNYGALIDENWHKGNIFPKKLKQAHDDSYKNYQKKRAGILKRAINKVYSELDSAGLDKVNMGEYTVVLPKSQDDFIKEGDQLNICVGGMGYSDRYSMRKNIIFFIRKSDDLNHSFCCCEASVRKGSFYLKQSQLYDHKEAPENIKKYAEKYISILSEKLTVENEKIYVKAA